MSRLRLVLISLAALYACAAWQTSTGAGIDNPAGGRCTPDELERNGPGCNPNRDKVLGLDGLHHCVRLDLNAPGWVPSTCTDGETGTPTPGAVPSADLVPTGDHGARGAGPELSREEVAALWRRHGGPESQVATAVAVATAESGRRPAAANTTNGDGSADFGLWQINTVHRKRFEQVTGRTWADVLDPDANTAYAVFLHREQGWRPWVAYTSGAYRRHLL